MSPPPHPEPDAAPATDARPRYGVYGLTLASEFPFAYPLPPASGAPGLRFTCRSEAPAGDFWDHAESVYAGALTRNDDRSGLYRRADDEVLRFTDAADFYLQPEHITCHLRDPAYDYGVEIWLLGAVLAYWLERCGLPMLHAAAVVVDGRAAAFLSHNKGGKSSLAAVLMQAGHPLLTDDLLPLEIRNGTPTGRPGYPQMRFWPDQAEHFTTRRAERFDRVVPHLDKRCVPVGADGLGSFCGAPRPLACFYLPERRAREDPSGEIEITPISPRDAVVELVGQSFLANLVEAAGLQPERLKLLFQVARRVPMRRIRYPSGTEHLPRVRDAVLEDLRAHS